MPIPTAHTALALRPRSLHRVPTGEPLTTTPDPNTPPLHVPDNDLATSIHLRLLHERLPNPLEHMSGNLNLDMNIVDIQLTEPPLTDIVNEEALQPETAHRILNLHLVRDLLRHQHHEPPPDEGRLPVQISPVALHLAIGTLACLADLVAAHLIEQTLLIEKTPLAARIMEITIVIVNRPQSATGSPQRMDLPLIHLAHHVIVRARSDFAAALGHIQIAPQPDQTSF